jgi:hypothetical protein
MQNKRKRGRDADTMVQETFLNLAYANIEGKRGKEEELSVELKRLQNKSDIIAIT